MANPITEASLFKVTKSSNPFKVTPFSLFVVAPFTPFTAYRFVPIVVVAFPHAKALVVFVKAYLLTKAFSTIRAFHLIKAFLIPSCLIIKAFNISFFSFIIIIYC